MRINIFVRQIYSYQILSVYCSACVEPENCSAVLHEYKARFEKPSGAPVIAQEKK